LVSGIINVVSRPCPNGSSKFDIYVGGDLVDGASFDVQATSELNTMPDPGKVAPVFYGHSDRGEMLGQSGTLKVIEDTDGLRVVFRFEMQASGGTPETLYGEITGL